MEVRVEMEECNRCQQCNVHTLMWDLSEVTDPPSESIKRGNDITDTTV